MIQLDVLARNWSMLLMAKFGVDATLNTLVTAVPITGPFLSGTPGLHMVSATGRRSALTAIDERQSVTPGRNRSWQFLPTPAPPPTPVLAPTPQPCFSGPFLNDHWIHAALAFGDSAY